MNIRLSACTITKNEALNIGKSIDSYKDYVDEIIIVDTGSIDETKDIANGKNAKVLDFEWKNDFSAAKNFALDNATGDWIIFLDADEWFDGDSAKNIKEAIDKAASLNYSAVACKLVNYFTETEVMETASTIRVFKKADNIRFNRAIHETLFDVSKGTALPGLYSELFTVNHSGYMKDILEKKAKRNKMLLDKNFAMGQTTYIDYFYGMRENLKEDIMVAEYFYKLIENTPNYDELVSSFNITTSVDESKLKVMNLLPNKYSFEYRENFLKEIEKKYSQDANFKFYEYLLYKDFDKKEAIKALKEAVEYEKIIENDNMAISANPFFGKKSEANQALGEYCIFINDKLKALEYFTAAIKSDYSNLKALMGVLHIISAEKNEDIILFLNSIFDISDKNVEKYLVDALRITKFKEIFLYYFVDYYKKFEEVERSYFTSRLLTGNFEEVIDKYMGIYKEEKDERAILLVTSALILGNMREKYLKIKENIFGIYLKILKAYFEDQKIENVTENEFQILLTIFKEFACIAGKDTINEYFNVCSVAKEKLYFEAIKYYYFQYDYDKILEFSDEIEENRDFSQKLKLYVNKLKVNIYFCTNKFEKIPDCLDKVISGGYLDEDIVLICEMLEADDEKLQEYFELINSYSFARKNINLDKIQDILSDSVKFMTVENFKEEIKNKKISLVEEYSKMFFDFAKKAYSQKAFAVAEKYYKLSLKYSYNNAHCYFALGDIYNYFGKPDLSYYCYENAFIENIVLARDILPGNHVNRNYVFSRKAETERNFCPVCNGESKPDKVYVSIESDELSYNEPLIKKYYLCSKCGHMFVGNDIAEKIYWEKEKDTKIDDEKISLSYDILESICEITDGDVICDCSGDNGEFEVPACNYGFKVHHDLKNKKSDVIFAGNLLNNTYDFESSLSKCTEALSQEGVIVFRCYDEGNAFSKLSDKPLWAKNGVKNVFSKESIEILFNKFGLHILQINVDKVNKGQIIVFVGR